jgi:hypothetical protein
LLDGAAREANVSPGASAGVLGMSMTGELPMTVTLSWAVAVLKAKSSVNSCPTATGMSVYPITAKPVFCTVIV